MKKGRLRLVVYRSYRYMVFLPAIWNPESNSTQVTFQASSEPPYPHSPGTPASRTTSHLAPSRTRRRGTAGRDRASGAGSFQNRKRKETWRSWRRVHECTLSSHDDLSALALQTRGSGRKERF